MSIRHQAGISLPDHAGYAPTMIHVPIWQSRFHEPDTKGYRCCTAPNQLALLDDTPTRTAQVLVLVAAPNQLPLTVISLELNDEPLRVGTRIMSARLSVGPAVAGQRA